MGNKKNHVTLTDEEVTRLKKLAKSPASNKLIRKRINIQLDMDESHGHPLTYHQCVKSIETCIMNVYHVAIPMQQKDWMWS